jgi:hypothetical protein
MSHRSVYEIYIEGGPRKYRQAGLEAVELLAIRPEDNRPKRTLLTVAVYDRPTQFEILAQIGALNLRLMPAELRATP